jgi:hypothetical protein
MRFHIVSNHMGNIYFFRRMNYPFPNEEAGDSTGRELFQTYIHHALDASYTIDEFDLEIKNENLTDIIKPYIHVKYDVTQPIESYINSFIDKLSTFPKIDNNIICVEQFSKWETLLPTDGIYVYFNSINNTYIITRRPFNLYYFSHFVLKWSEVNLNDTMLQFVFQNDNRIIKTRDVRIVDAYYKFIQTLTIKQVSGNYPGGGGDDDFAPYPSDILNVIDAKPVATPRGSGGDIRDTIDVPNKQKDDERFWSEYTSLKAAKIINTSKTIKSRADCAPYKIFIKASTNFGIDTNSDHIPTDDVKQI